MTTSTIAAEVAALQSMPAEELARRYHELFGREPRVRNAAWLRRQVGWKLQERALGGLGERARARLDELVAATELPVANASTPRPRPAPRSTTDAPLIGTVLTREWHGEQVRVVVAEGSFIWNGKPFGSLSAVAKAITGASWSGALFFNLRKRSTSA